MVAILAARHHDSILGFLIFSSFREIPDDELPAAGACNPNAPHAFSEGGLMKTE
jgi:hypothetical protein